ncbi:hypothetical protein FOTG_17690 [Fusarium oxysporum f. sp. vasinfectum 25433]|uniref:Uncharacterized protein n=1 Tax=Fusarium oxysporum f. sp. vasinfectum 25433 TaxID=1089449 RepID=X0KYM0_FUSOX|nr:hypothetical protein FOTG_17690 [Fusarium oxysporum f. sp. vasinfectum 25433]
MASASPRARTIGRSRSGMRQRVLACRRSGLAGLLPIFYSTRGQTLSSLPTLDF